MPSSASEPYDSPPPRDSQPYDSPPRDSQPYDLAVIGAGPAGLSGAVAAAGLGLKVALLDASEHIGGQFYRHPAAALGAVRPEALHHDWSAFAALRRRLAASGVSRLAGHHVWSVTGEFGDWSVHAVTGADGDEEQPVRVRARALLLATGASERQLPFPGWTLPGVVGAGGAQAMLKSGLVLPGKRVVVAGSGPLLLAVAGSLAAAGARVPAVVEASGYLRYARHPWALAANPHKLVEGVVHGGALLRHRVRPLLRSAVVEAHGTERVQAVTVARLDRDWRPVPGSRRRIACDALAVGHGLAPQLDLATTLGCATRRTADATAALVLGDSQETTVPGVWSAGETGGVGGSRLAITEGALAAHAIAARLVGGEGGAGGAGGAGPSGRAAGARRGRVGRLRRDRDRMRAFADAMAVAHAPGPGWPRWLPDDTDVCRCEEVTAGRVREAVTDLGAGDARTVKLLTRAGMGWCQGRMCGAAVACLAASGGGETPPPAERRPFAVPVTLGALAGLAPDAAPDAVPDTPTDD
ncbi:FAD-dependent oxidoreductase [Streptomyces sp. O3]